MNLDSYIYMQMLRRIKDLNARAKTKTQKKKTAINLNGIGLGNGFSDVTPKTQTPQGAGGKQVNCTLSKLKIFVLQRRL